MPWTLNTPILVGDLDPCGMYSQVKIVSQLHNSSRGFIELKLEYGNTVNEKWKSGIRPLDKDVYVKIVGDKYDTLVSAMPLENEGVYDAVKRCLYNYLAENGNISPGVLS